MEEAYLRPTAATLIPAPSRDSRMVLASSQAPGVSPCTQSVSALSDISSPSILTIMPVLTSFSTRSRTFR